MTVVGWPSRFRRFVAYACVGALGTVAQYSVLSVLVLTHACGAVFASALGSIAGAIINYVLNYHLTFRATASHVQTAPRFFAVAVAGAMLNSAVMYALIHRLDMSWLAAQCTATLCVLCMTYCANLVWSFRAQGT